MFYVFLCIFIVSLVFISGATDCMERLVSWISYYGSRATAFSVTV